MWLSKVPQRRVGRSKEQGKSLTLQGKIKGRQGCVQTYKQGKDFLVKVPLQLSFEVLGCRHIMRQVTFLASNNPAS